MCWHIITLSYLCGHQKQSSHGIPDQFIRECNRSHGTFFNRCQTIHSHVSQEQIPWLCPGCHWSIINRGLGPLYASAIQTGHSTINRLADIISGDHSMRILALSNQFSRAIQQTQDSIFSSGDIFHALAAQALSDFLGAARFRMLQDEAPTVDNPWKASLSHAPHNPFQRLVLPEASSEIQPGWTLGPAPQARASPPPDYFGESDNARPPAPEPMPMSSRNVLPHPTADATSQSSMYRTSPSIRPLSTFDLARLTVNPVRPANTLPIPAPEYDSMQHWHSTDLTRMRQPRPTQNTIVEEGESSESEFEDDPPTTILTRELHRKERELHEMLNLPVPSSVRADVLALEIADLKMIIGEEKIVEGLREQLEPLIDVLNTMTGAGVARQDESRVVLRARIDTLYERFDTINVDRASRGVPTTRTFQVGCSTRELILIRNQDNSDLPRYDESDSTQTDKDSVSSYQDGYQADQYQNDYQGNYQDYHQHSYQEDSQTNSEADLEDDSTNDFEEEIRQRLGEFLNSADGQSYMQEEDCFSTLVSRLEELVAELQRDISSVRVGLDSLLLSLQSSSCPPNQEPPVGDNDIVMGGTP